MRKSIVKKKKSELKRSYPELKKKSGIVLYTSRGCENHASYFHNTMQQGEYDCGFYDEAPILTQAHPTLEESLKKICKVICSYGLDLDTENEKYDDSYVLFDEMMTYIRENDVGNLQIIDSIE